MFHWVLCTPLLKLQVLFIKRTSSKFIVTHLRYCNVFDVVSARINETLCPLSDVTLSKNLVLLCDCMFATNPKTIIYNGCLIYVLSIINLVSRIFGKK